MDLFNPFNVASLYSDLDRYFQLWGKPTALLDVPRPSISSFKLARNGCSSSPTVRAEGLSP